MTRDEVRRAALNEIDDALGRWIVPRRAKALITALRPIIQQDDALVDKINQNLPVYQEGGTLVAKAKAFKCPAPTREQMESALSTAGVDKAKMKGFDLKTVFALFIQVLSQLVNMMPAPTASAAAGEDELANCDCGECLDCAICCQVHSLHAMVAAKAAAANEEQEPAE